MWRRRGVTKPPWYIDHLQLHHFQGNVRIQNCHWCQMIQGIQSIGSLHVGMEYETGRWLEYPHDIPILSHATMFDGKLW